MFGSVGNCWQTVVASILDLPLEDVPHFVKIDDDGGENWWIHTQRWLAERGYTLEAISTHPDTDELYFVTGPSPRFQGLAHVVIYQHGRMIHDPHPDATGVLEEKYFEIIRKKD